MAELKRKLDEEQNRRTRDQTNSQAVAERISSLEKQLMEANDKLKQEADSHNKTKKQNAEFAMGAAGREHTLLELQDKVGALQRARDSLEAEVGALQVKLTASVTDKLVLTLFLNRLNSTKKKHRDSRSRNGKRKRRTVAKHW